MFEIIVGVIVVLFSLLLYYERSKRKAIEAQLRECRANEEQLKIRIETIEGQLRKLENELSECRKEGSINEPIRNIISKLSEQIAPLVMIRELGVDPKDIRYVGSPVDFIAFKGLSEKGEVEEILFVEVDTGKSTQLSKRELAVKEAVENKRVRWVSYNLRHAMRAIMRALEQEIEACKWQTS